MGTKLGGKPTNKPGGKKQFKPYNNNAQKKGNVGKKKFGFTKEGHGSQKRKMSTDNGRSSSVPEEEHV